MQRSALANLGAEMFRHPAEVDKGFAERNSFYWLLIGGVGKLFGGRISCGAECLGGLAGAVATELSVREG